MGAEGVSRRFFQKPLSRTCVPAHARVAGEGWTLSEAYDGGDSATRALVVSDRDPLRRRLGEEWHDVACEALQAGAAAYAAT